MRNANSRRGQTSITHLMNFTLPPRPQDYRNTIISRGTRRANLYGIGSGHHSSDKARYVTSGHPTRLFSQLLGTFTRITVSSSSPMVTTSNNPSMLTNPWIGTMSCRFLPPRYHRTPLVRFASHTQSLPVWQNAVTFSASLV